MKNTLFILMLFVLAAGCETKDNYIDTGICKGKHDYSIYEYLHTDSYNWDSTILLIQQADMVALFEGTEQITFWGPTNHSIRRYLLKNKLKRITDIEPRICKDILKKHICMGKYMTTDIDFQIPSISEDKIIGGTEIPSLSKYTLHAYKQQRDFGNIIGAGAIKLYLRSSFMNDWGFPESEDISVASTDIECTNGVVHSLDYDYALNEF